mmetsp:Transcript_21995/g.51593  ORF Transcript_21995/g.51593 Transcript_21995/m.51593 type:complete len:415 (+) Transcript_21995:73-1317(+)
MAASRASIKRAVLAARLLRKTEESAADARDFAEDSKPAGAAEGFRGGSVASKIRIQKQLTSRSGSGGLSPSKSRSFEDESEAPDPGIPGPGLAGRGVGQDTGGHLRLEDLDDAAHRNKSQEAHTAPVFGGLAALKVKHRLQALHQEAKKKQPALPSIGPANLSVTNATAADKIPEVPVAAPSQNQASNSVAALVSAARTTLPKFSGATEEEAEIKSLLGEVDKDLLDALKEVSRSLTWLFNDSDTDFDNQLTYKQLKAIFARPGAPLGPGLGLEVDASTSASEKEDFCNRLRFLEVFILVAIRVNQSPVLTSRVQDAKRDLSRGLAFSKRGSGSGSGLTGSSGELEGGPKVSILAGVPRMNMTDGREKWESAVRRLSAVLIGAGQGSSAEDRRKEPEPPSPLANLEKLFAQHLP